MKKTLAILLATLMVLSMTACTTKGTILDLFNHGENGTAEVESEDFTWSWDYTDTEESFGTLPEPDPLYSETFINNFKGDWHGWMYFQAATGKYAQNAQKNCEMIARFIFDDDALTTFLALAINDNEYNFKKSEGISIDDQTMSISTTVFQTACESFVLTANSTGSLSMTMRIGVEEDEDYVLIVATLRRIGDNSWNSAVDNPCFPADYVTYYADKSFDFIAESYGLDVSTIPTENGSEGETESESGDHTLTGKVTTVAVDSSGHVEISFPEGWTWDDDYDWIRKDNSSVHIAVDTLLGTTNVQEWREVYLGGKDSYDSFKFEETTVNGYAGFRCEYADWLGKYIAVVHDFGGKLDSAGLYGVKFTVSGDDTDDLWTDEIQAIIWSLELK